MDELHSMLFDACRDGKVEIIKRIVQNDLKLIMKKDAQNNTALHIACESGLMLDGVECLYSAYPDALTIFNDEGASPFHMMCFHGKSLENLKFLHNKSAIGLVTTNEDGDLPMHWISDTASEELVKYLIEKFPKSVEAKNKQDALPIHVACNKGLSLNVIRLLHEAYPDGILQPDKEGILPIHDACEGSPNLELVKLFYEVAPASFKKADNKGNFALHHAVCSAPEVIQFIIEANKLALQKPNNSGYLPIHIACRLSAETNVIKTLHENYPEGIKVKTSKGFFPFHLAMTSLPTLTYLHKLFDEAIEIPDKRGRYPINIACEKGAPLDVIAFLAEKCPAAAQKADCSNMLPLHYAIESNLSLATIRHLIELYPGALHCSNADHHDPFDLVFLRSNDLETFQLLRASYFKEFQDLARGAERQQQHPSSQSRFHGKSMTTNRRKKRRLDIGNSAASFRGALQNRDSLLPSKKKITHLKNNDISPPASPKSRRNSFLETRAVVQNSSSCLSSRSFNEPATKKKDKKEKKKKIVKEEEQERGIVNRESEHGGDNGHSIEDKNAINNASASSSPIVHYPSDEDILNETSHMLNMTIDRNSVTVGDIIRTLEKKHNVTFETRVKVLIRDRLAQLVSQGTNESDDDESSSNQSLSSNDSSSEDDENDKISATQTNANSDHSNNYELKRGSLCQTRTGSWTLGFFYDKRRNLGCYKTQEMTEAAFDLLKTKLATQECNDAKLMDELVLQIRNTVRGT